MVLVPVNFETDGGSRREELELHFKRLIRADRSARLLILGKPGSGKTVAMWLLARIAWTLDFETPLVPVLLTFFDIKEVRDKEMLEVKIVEKLEYFQFAQGQRDNTNAKEFAAQNLYSGNMLLLFDGFDELEKSTRETISRVLNNFLGTHPHIPSVISSRTVVYEKSLSFDELNPKKINMAPFTPFAILKFLSQWRFEEGKSSHQFFEMINGKAHLSELASNPLMLTIIAFLYSLPKYTLPDNRVQFYEQCSRALLEEWDRSQQRDRANKFESHQKIAVLNRVAFEHVSNADKNDELIHENTIHDVARGEMKKLGLKVEEYPLMKDEIVQNSGLLHHIPPANYRYPHRTFMDFFAANYLDTEKDCDEMLALYGKDPEKWKEVLLLYVGVNKNKEFSDRILTRLGKDFIRSWKNNESPDLLVFAALTQCAVPEPGLAVKILDMAGKYSKQKNYSPEIIEELGYIAANPRWTYAKHAKRILLDLLHGDVSDDCFQDVLFSLIHSGDEKIGDVILQNLERVNLSEIFSKFGSKGKFFIHKLFSMNLPESRMKQIIEGLREAGNFEVLGHLLLESRDETVRELAAYALYRMSRPKEFFDFLDSMEIGLLDEETKKIVDAQYKKWGGWNRRYPLTDSGGRMAFLICHYAASWIGGNLKRLEKDDLKQTNNWLSYLITGLLVGRGVKYNELVLICEISEDRIASEKGLIRYWKQPGLKKNLWNRVWGEERCLLIAWGPYLLSSIIGVVGYALYLFNFTSNRFFFYFFDSLTTKILFFQFVGFCSINLFCFFLFKDLVFTKRFGFGEFFLALIGGALLIFKVILETVPRKSLEIAEFLLIFFVICSTGIFFLPFHNMLLNLLFFLHFFFGCFIYLSYFNLDFTLFNLYEVKRLYSYLDEPDKELG